MLDLQSARSAGALFAPVSHCITVSRIEQSHFPGTCRPGHTQVGAINESTSVPSISAIHRVWPYMWLRSMNQRRASPM
jgi:hypothetical protein